MDGFFIVNWSNSYYKSGQVYYKSAKVLQRGADLLQIGAGITNQSNCYKSVRTHVTGKLIRNT